MKKKYTPYYFDEKNEYKIYSKIGKKHYEEFKHKKKQDSKILLDFDKYSDWEKYFSTKYSKGYNNDSNFIHYLIKNHRMYRQGVELCKTLMIPICVAIVTIMLTICSDHNYPIEVMIISLTISMIIVEIPCMISFFCNQKKADFYMDCIEVMKNNIASHQN